MDYKKHYYRLIETRRNRKSDVTIYYEKHHIIPKCLGGDDSENNVVILTYKEHYMAHYLLSKIHTDTIGIQYAFLCMLRDPYGRRAITSKMYATIKTKYKEFMSWRFKIENPMHTDSARKKQSDRMKSNNPQHIIGSKCRRFEVSPSKGKVAYNNGVKNSYFVEGTQPEGWIKGLKKYDRYWKPRTKKDKK